MLGFVGLGRGRFLVALGLVLFVLFVFVNVGQVWATSFSPNPPVAGQPFTITGLFVGDSISVYGACGCNGNCGITSGSSPYTLTLSAGQYNALDSSGCTSFTVIPAQYIPEYPYGLPILVIFMVLTYAVIKRRTLTRN